MTMKGKKNWIKGAIHNNGALSRAADRAHMTTHGFADKHQHDSGTTGRRARLALTLAKINSNRRIEG